MHYSKFLQEELIRELKIKMREEFDSLRSELIYDFSGPLGIKDAARYLKVSSQTIYKYVEANSIPFYQNQPKSKIYFFREELDQWVKEKRRISKKEILNEADNLKIGGHGGK